MGSQNGFDHHSHVFCLNMQPVEPRVSWSFCDRCPGPRTGDAEGARKVLPKSLAALPRQKHPVVVSKAAILEYQLLGSDVDQPKS